MKRYLFALGAAFIASSASAQSQTTTNCQFVLGTMQCTSNNSGIDWNAYNQQQQEINRRNQENINRSMQNLGSAIAADRERRRAKRVQRAVEKAIASDPATLLPLPDESPVTLSCSSSIGGFTAALYEQSGRADVTSGGITKSRSATFAANTVSWESAVWRSAVNRTDLSFVGVAVLPELDGMTVTGTCQIAQRQF